MDHQKQSRLSWIRMYLEVQDAGLVCRRCGISRPALRKWLKRYNELAEEGLNEISRKPHCSPNTKINDEIIELIKTLRARNLSAKRTASSTLNFLDEMVEWFLFPIQRIQTDRGLEFFVLEVQAKLMEYGIKFRPIKPRSPHLNGKVERSQQTDLREFYATADLSDFEKLQDSLAEWEFYYNWHRPHSSLNGKSPNDVATELSKVTPFSDEVYDKYNITKERIQLSNY